MESFLTYYVTAMRVWVLVFKMVPFLYFPSCSSSGKQGGKGRPPPAKGVTRAGVAVSCVKMSLQQSCLPGE